MGDFRPKGLEIKELPNRVRGIRSSKRRNHLLIPRDFPEGGANRLLRSTLSGGMVLTGRRRLIRSEGEKRVGSKGGPENRVKGQVVDGSKKKRSIGKTVIRSIRLGGKRIIQRRGVTGIYRKRGI